VDGTGPQLLQGTAPNLYQLTKTGAQLILENGIVEDIPARPHYGPTNGVLLRHELALAQAYVWLKSIEATDSAYELEVWRTGSSAVCELETGQSSEQSKSYPRNKSKIVLRPDALVVLRLDEPVLVAAIEIDLATERGVWGKNRWTQKIQAYERLFQGGTLQRVLGYRRGRVLVLCPTESRCNALADLIQAHAPPEFSQRFWFVEQRRLEDSSLYEPCWIQATTREPHPLVPQKNDPDDK
jgi:hypothetical protein